MACHGSVSVGKENDVYVGRSSPHVLIVEGNPLIAFDLENILGGYGCKVIGPHSSSVDALDALAAEDIDAAVIDFLDDQNAALVTEILNRRKIPFAICTAEAKREIYQKYPHTPVLRKPFQPEDVSVVVNSLIASRLAFS